MSAPPLPQQDAGEAAPRPRELPLMRRGHAARLLPPTRLGGPIPWVIAILISLVVIAAAGGLALRNLADNARAELSGALTVQVIEAEPERRAELADITARIIRAQDNVTSVRVVPEKELDAMLEPWLGAAAESEDLPVPALIDVELAGRASPEAIARLEQVVRADVPNARIDAQAEWLRPVYDALSALQYLALALIALVGLATAAAVWLAARSAFANHRRTVEIIHLLGGTDAQVTRIFLRSVVRDAAFGALVGIALGIGAVWLLARQFAALDSGMVAGGGLQWQDWAVIAAIPVAGVMLAYATGRMTIMRELRIML